MTRDEAIQTMEKTGRYNFVSEMSPDVIVFEDLFLDKKLRIKLSNGKQILSKIIVCRDFYLNDYLKNQFEQNLANKNDFILNTSIHKQLENLFIKFCEIMGLTPEELKSKSRKHPLPELRYAYFYIAKQTVTGCSLSQIGKIIGDRSHCDVLYGLKKAEYIPEIKKVIKIVTERL